MCDPVDTAQDILAGKENTLTLKDRGTLPSQPIDPLTSNNILLDVNSGLIDQQTRQRRKAAQQ